MLCVRLDSLGDVLLTGGAVRAVAGAARRVTMLVAPGQTAAAALLPGVDASSASMPRGCRSTLGRSSAAPPVGWSRTLRRRRIDAAMMFTSFHQSALPIALLLRLAGVRWIGAISDDYPGSLLDLRHRVPDDLPEAERGLSLVEAAGFHADPAGATLARPASAAGRPEVAA